MLALLALATSSATPARPIEELALASTAHATPTRPTEEVWQSLRGVALASARGPPARVWKTLRQSLGETSTQVWDSVKSSVGGATSWVHARRLQFGLESLFNFDDPAATVQAARDLFCTEQVRSSLDGLDEQVKQVLPNAKPLGPIIDAGWSCLCSDFQVTDEYAELAQAITGALADDGVSTEAKVEAVVEALQAIIPVVMGEQGLCSTGCKSFVVKLGDWAIGSVTWDVISEDLAFLPPLSQLAGFPAAAMDCACNAISWTSFASLLSTDGFGEIAGDLGEVVGAIGGVGDSGDAAPGSLENAMDVVSNVSVPGAATALRSVMKYPQFFLSGEGFCAAGCSKGFKQVTDYVLDVAAAALGQEESLAPVSSAVAELSSDGLHACTCGGTLDWDELITGISSAVDAFTMESPLDDVPGMILGAVFAPSFLCSSPTCKAMTADFMNVVSSVGSVFPGSDPDSDGSDGSDDGIGAALAAISDIEWCPASESAAGFTIQQTYVLGETLESFSLAKQDAFKAALVSKLNGGVTTVVKLTKSAVTLKIRAGSIRCDAQVAVAQPALADQVETQMGTLAATSTDDLSVLLGVSVIEQPTAADKGTIAASKSNAAGGDDDGDGNEQLIIILVAVGASVLALVLLGVVLACFCSARNRTGIFRQDSITKEAPVTKADVLGGKPALQGHTSL